MPVDVIELGKHSRATTHAVDPKDLEQSYVYQAKGSNDEPTIKAAIIGVAPATVTVDTFTLYQTTLRIGRIAPDTWRCEMRYRAFELPAPGDIEISFDTEGGTARVTQALAHLSDHAPSGETPANFYGAINVTDSGVEGTDIEVPAFNFEYHVTFTAASVTQTYATTLGLMTKSVNQSLWHGFAAGTVFFRGVSSPKIKKSAPTADLVFKFRYEPVDSARTDANSISLPDRNGHDVLWYSQRRDVDTSAERLTHRSVSAHIDRVYSYANFSTLNLGASPWP